MRTAAALLAVAGLVGASADSCKVNPAPAPGGVTVSSHPQASNPGVGQVSGDCHLSIKGPAPDDTAGSGLKVKQLGSHTFVVAGFVWGYCTDHMPHYTLDLYIHYDAGAGPYQVNHKTIGEAPGPVPTPFAITAHCLPGEYQLTYQLLAVDEAGNMIGGNKVYGGKPIAFTAKQCGLAAR